MPLSVSDESYDNWKSFAPGMSISDCEMAFWGGVGVSLTDAKGVVFPGSDSIARQERSYWKTRAEALGLVAGTEFSLADYKLFAQINGG